MAAYDVDEHLTPVQDSNAYLFCISFARLGLGLVTAGVHCNTGYSQSLEGFRVGLGLGADVRGREGANILHLRKFWRRPVLHKTSCSDIFPPDTARKYSGHLLPVRAGA